MIVRHSVEEHARRNPGDTLYIKRGAAGHYIQTDTEALEYFTDRFDCVNALRAAGYVEQKRNVWVLNTT